MAERPGRTAKISISLRREELDALRKRAKRLHGGNISAVISELAADAARFEAMHALVERLGGPTLTDAERAALDAEWAGGPPLKAAQKARARVARKGAPS